MEKRKRWQLFVILAVVLLTIYNILPTVFYYTKPLKAPIGAERAHDVAEQVVERVDGLEKSSEKWIKAFAKNLGLKVSTVTLRAEDPQLIDVTFEKDRDASIFKKFLPQAGLRIPFVPAQLGVAAAANDGMSKVTVKRNIDVEIDPAEVDDYFIFSFKTDAKGSITPVYRNVVYDRLARIGVGVGGVSYPSSYLFMALNQPVSEGSNDAIVSLAREIVDYTKLFGENSDVAHRYYANFTQNKAEMRRGLISRFVSRLKELRDELGSKIKEIESTRDKLQAEGKFLEVADQQDLEQLGHRREVVSSALSIVKKKQKVFESGLQPMDRQEILTSLRQGGSENVTDRQVLNIGDNNPFIAQLILDWNNEQIMVRLHSDIVELDAPAAQDGKELQDYVKDKIQQSVIGVIARVAQSVDEDFLPHGNDFIVNLSNMNNSRSFLLFDLASLAAKKTDVVKRRLADWGPDHGDLQPEVFPVYDSEAFKALPLEEQGLGLVVYAPVLDKGSVDSSFRMNSIYVIAKGLNNIIQKYEAAPNADESKVFVEDFTRLRTLLQQYGFFGYPGSAYGLPAEYRNDYVFELNDYYGTFLAATREDFTVHGSQRNAILEFTDLEQRIITTNKINRAIHDDLLRWRDDYHAAKISRDPMEKFLVPAPTSNAFWQNLKISAYQYFHGDDRKVIHWGLDLAGGKSVRIGLKDQNNKMVTNKDELREGVNELYARVNKMGVSEVNIRVEGNNIGLDFPGSQNLSAEELITASSMTFHVVNEKFCTYNSALKDATNSFLQEVWNEAVVTNKKSITEINEIAWRHLGGNYEDVDNVPRSEHAQLLYDNGLRLASPQDTISNSFNDTLSRIARFRGEDYKEWNHQSHPLIIVFNNYALEGSSLEGVHTEYNPSKGNTLIFSVKSSYGGKEGRKGDPQDDLYAWTSQFSETKVVGTPKESYSDGHGWRMAVILNDFIVSWPHLAQPLRNHGEITGNFTQGAINQLAADLKAGSLSYTPQILSEKNISPELGKSERNRGIMATFLGLVFVVVVMIGYYYFSGLVASVAVLFNLLIMWGILQNLDAVLTLPGIAGIILTIGMAVDANVLVFERIREEYAISKRISSALQAGYRKAFSAIVDSNITTILAALILMHFDSGPIKGFAVTLIIGIASSMFTALFMTRYFFTVWVRYHKNKPFKMRNFIKSVKFNFLGRAKYAVTIALLIIVVGGYLCVMQRQTMLGMDFTGGYSVTLPVERISADTDYPQLVEKALLSKGALPGDFEVRSLNQPNILQIQLGTSMNQEDHPFYGMGEGSSKSEVQYSYETNPRLTWLVNALMANGIQISDTTLSTLDNNWSTISSQFSDTMRDQALMALGCAVIFILIYLSIRFEFKYAISAIICLVHDVLISLGILGILHVLKVPVQIDLQIIGALMTIIGYSLNDTIIIFDRIREDVRLNKKVEFNILVNNALNKTLSRTLLTSVTTLLVLVALVLFGGSVIFDFALVMMIGVIFGTLSSWFIASPVMLYFHSREVQKKKACHA